MDKTDRLRDYGLAFLLYEQGLGICGYELIRELFIFIKLILNSYLTMKDLYNWDDDGKWPVEEEHTDVYTVTNYTNDSFLLTQIYPTEDKDRVRVFTRFK